MAAEVDAAPEGIDNDENLAMLQGIFEDWPAKKLRQVLRLNNEVGEAIEHLLAIGDPDNMENEEDGAAAGQKTTWFRHPVFCVQ